MADQPASIRYEIQIDARDEDSKTSSRFLHWARSGRTAVVEQAALEEFDRVKRAMQGQDEGIFADHFVTATLLKGDPAEISSTPNQTTVEAYHRPTTKDE